MNVTIIAFSQSSKELTSKLKEWKSTKDKLIFISRGNWSRKVNNAINNSEFRHIIIFNPEFNFFDKNYIELFKKHFSEDYISVYTDQFKEDKMLLPSKNTAISFSKVNFSSLKKNCFAPIVIQRCILCNFTSVNVINGLEEEKSINEKKALKEFWEKVDENRKDEESVVKRHISPQKSEPKKDDSKPKNLTSIQKAQKIATTKERRSDKFYRGPGTERPNRERPKKTEKHSRPVRSSKNPRPEDTKPLYNPEDSKKPKIKLICDVKGWAWWIKSNYLVKHLSDYYDFEMINLIGPNKGKIGKDTHDIYFTFGYSYVGYVKNLPFRKRATGITAHRPHHLLRPRMQMAYATHANSVLLYNELCSMHSNVFYVPNGVDENLFIEKKPVMQGRDEPIIGHVGKKGKMKNQQAILEPAIKKANADYRPHYNDYTNKVPHDKMVDIHNEYDVFIAASDEDGTPNGMLEAAACGRPIIINNIGNAPEFVTNGYNGFVVEKKVDAYVEAIRWFRNNPDKVYEMGQNARAEIERAWTWELMAKNYMYMFDYILGIERESREYENPAMYHV